jgi:hypothetical protein
MLIIKIRIKFNSHTNKFEKQKNKITKIKLSSIRNVTKMQTHLISQDLDNLLLLDVINEDFKEQSKLIFILISSLTQQSPLAKIYEKKKKLLLDNLNSQRLNEKNIFRDKLVSVFNILNV